MESLNSCLSVFSVYLKILNLSSFELIIGAGCDELPSVPTLCNHLSFPPDILQRLMKAESGVEEDLRRGGRPRSSTVNEANTSTNNQSLPVVFKWDGTGKDIFLCGSFNNWQRIPMNKR